MKQEEREQYIKYRIETAHKTFDAAVLLLENNYTSSALGRFYYSVFHIVNALLVKNGIATKTHSGLKSQFFLHFIKTEKINIKYGQLLSELFDLRQKAEYGNLFEIEKEAVESLLVPVKNMINEIEKLITN